MRCGAIPEQAWKKVDTAYRSASRMDLQKALSAFVEDSRHQESCFQGLQVEDPGSILEGAALLLREIEA